MPGRKYSPEILAEAIRLRETRGMSFKAIAERLDMSHGSVYWHCLRQGADNPKAAARKLGKPPMISARGEHLLRRFSAEDDAVILDMRSSGASLSEIARKLGRRHHSISSRLLLLERNQERSLA